MNPDLMRIILPPKNPSVSHSCRGSSDPDSAIILPIILLLIADRGDFFLIFSLLYILL